MTRLTTLAEGPTELDRVWNLRRRYYELFLDDYDKSIQRVDPVLVELCRLRIAQLVESAFDQSLRYRRAVEAGLTEEKVQALTDYPTSDLFSLGSVPSSSSRSSGCSSPAASVTRTACASRST